MWRVLRSYGKPMKLLEAIKALYSTCDSKVQDGRWFKVGCGVRLGSALSPLLFIIYMDKVVKDIAAEGVDTVSYADEVALVSEGEKLLQNCVTEWLKSKIQAAEMRVLRLIFGVTLKGKIRIEVI